MVVQVSESITRLAIVISYYAITNKVKLLLESYQKNRKQFVQIGDARSTMVP